MKILYIGVHSHIDWGAEYWVAKAFKDFNINCDLLDYRLEFKGLNNNEINKIILKRSNSVKIIFLQRGDHLSPSIFNEVNIPIVFWSTEPLQLKNDVDMLLNSTIFSWVFIHSYSCKERIINEFPHLKHISSVMHNAAPKEQIKSSLNNKFFSIFNRTLSIRRRYWLFRSRKMIKLVKGVYGEKYFNYLQSSQIAINIHYSRKNLDDFESGIFEAMASGCLVISEKLNDKTLIDLGMKDVIIQVNSPAELFNKLQFFKQNSDLIKAYQIKSNECILKNTWHDRSKQMISKFKELFN